MNSYGTAQLARVALSYPAIDNHAHPLLKAAHRNEFPFEGLVSEASGAALTQDAVHTLACFRATQQLRQVLGLKGEPTWEAVKAAREKLEYDALCKLFMDSTGIQCILIDDGLGGSSQYAEDYKWHNRFTRSPTKRIVRVEVLAEVRLLTPHKPTRTQCLTDDLERNLRRTAERRRHESLSRVRRLRNQVPSRNARLRRRP